MQSLQSLIGSTLPLAKGTSPRKAARVYEHPDRPLRVLLVEDDDNDARIVHDLFADSILKHYRLERVANHDAVLEAINGFEHDIYILKCDEENGLDLLRAMIGTGCPAPIILTGNGNHDLDLQAMNAGAADYLQKGHVDAALLERSIRYALQRKRIEITDTGPRIGWEHLFDVVPDPVAIIDADYRLVRVNRAFADRVGLKPNDLTGSVCYTTVHNSEFAHEMCPHRLAMKDGKSHFTEIYDENMGGYFYISVSPYFDENSRVLGTMHVYRDITGLKKSEQEIRTAKQWLERKVVERTSELREKATELEGANAALRSLIREIGERTKEVEESVAANVSSGVAPAIQKLRCTGLSRQQRTYVDMIESQLSEVTGKFTKDLMDRYSSLTHMELQVARMVREGLANKEIAQNLNISENTVKSHRYNLRRKIGLTGGRTNLRKHLHLSNQ